MRFKKNDGTTRMFFNKIWEEMQIVLIWVIDAKCLFGILIEEVTVEVMEVNIDIDLTMWLVASVSTIHLVLELTW